MKKRALALILSAVMLTALSACSTTDNQETQQTEASTVSESTAEEQVAAEAADETDYTTGTPWINSNIESNVERAGDVSLKDDFNLAKNGQWVKENKIKSGWSSNTYASSFNDTLNEQLLGLMKQEPDESNHDAVLVSTFYKAFTDWETRDALGAEPLLPYLKRIEDIQNAEDLEAYITSSDYHFANVLSWGSTPDPQDATRNIIAFGAPGVFLQDAADYADLDNMSDYTRMFYDNCKKGVQTVLLKCGYTQEQIDEIYQGAIEFEKLMMAYCYTNDEIVLTETQDKLNTQIYTPDELKKYKWLGLLLKALEQYDIEEIPAVVLTEKIDYLEHLDELLTEDNLELIKDYLLAHTATNAMSRLDKATYYAQLDLQNEISGSTGYSDESEYAVGTVSARLAWPLSKLYCQQYVTAQDKQNIEELIEEIIGGYKEMIEKEDFLSDATKEKAIQKLDTMIVNCMYPDDWSEYSYDELELSDNFFDACIDILQFEREKELSEFNDPIDKTKWVEVPITQNAFYYFSNNSINMLPGLIGDVLYNKDMSKEEVYGKVGAVIGHEISHAFDALGSSYDADGNYKDWWTAEDKANYKEKTDKLVAYYDNISIWDGLKCDGELVKTEACADMGGIAVLLQIAAEDPDFDYEKFFSSFAQTWAANVTAATSEYLAKYDEHPLYYLRLNVTVAQFEEFYETFGIKEGDGMYIAPENRVKIW